MLQAKALRVANVGNPRSGPRPFRLRVAPERRVEASGEGSAASARRRQAAARGKEWERASQTHRIFAMPSRKCMADRLRLLRLCALALQMSVGDNNVAFRQLFRVETANAGLDYWRVRKLPLPKRMAIAALVFCAAELVAQENDSFRVNAFKRALENSKPVERIIFRISTRAESLSDEAIKELRKRTPQGVATIKAFPATTNLYFPDFCRAEFREVQRMKLSQAKGRIYEKPNIGAD
jgi:hypothetical protein